MSIPSESMDAPLTPEPHSLLFDAMSPLLFAAPHVIGVGMGLRRPPPSANTRGLAVSYRKYTRVRECVCACVVISCMLKPNRHVSRYELGPPAGVTQENREHRSYLERRVKTAVGCSDIISYAPDTACVTINGIE